MTTWREWLEHLGIWLGRQAGVDLRPFDPAPLHAAKLEVETLTLALDQLREAYHAAQNARDVAERIMRRLLEPAAKVPVPEAVWAAVPVARVLSAHWDATSAPGTSGEYKHHQVYAELQKQYPTTSKRDLALALELALR
jgi:hypothetical protein